jgi:hypothetical protein
VLFGLVANRALAPSSKLAGSEWMSRDVHIDGPGEVSGNACCRAMDWLHGVRGELEKQVYFAVAERGWRDMKSVLDLRPVYHLLEEL